MIVNQNKTYFMEKILIIEDNPNIRENTVEILQLMNYKVFSAENGKIGVEAALRETPDLILCDIMMPVLDGYGVLHMLRKNSSTKNTPFIFLTAKTERDDFRKGMELGADDYITKPFNETELLKAIECRLKKVKLQKDEYSNELNGFQQLSNSGVGKDLLDDLVSGRNINTYKKKQLIFSEGNRPAFLYYIRKGKVKTYKTNDNGKELVVGLFTENDFFGYVELLENTNYHETAAAMEETALAIIPHENFEELLNSSKEVSQKFIRILAKNIAENENKLLGLAYNSLRKKVADALITLFEKYKKGNEEKFPISITRDNLASIAGTAIESLIRTLGDFKHEKLIDIKDGIITILNKKKLENLLN